MSFSENTLGFIEFLKENSNSLLAFVPTGQNRPALILNVSSQSNYYELSNKFMKQLIESKRLDLDSFRDSEINQKLLYNMNFAVHSFIQELLQKKQLTAYVEGLR